MKPAPPTNKGQKFPAEPLTEAEVHQLLDAASHRSPSGVRLRALIGVLYGAGLRLAEALALAPRDVDTQARTLHVRHGKGNKDRLVGLDPFGCSLLDRWMDARKDLGLTARHLVFATYEAGKVGRPLDQRYVRLALTRLAARADIHKRVHPHGFRHSLAFAMAQEGRPTHVIQQQLGHANLSITDTYVSHLMPADVIRVMANRDWSKKT